MSSMKFLVLGGGMSGTYSAKRLSDLGFDVTVITTKGGATTAPFMHLRSHPRTKLLLKTFGIEDKDSYASIPWKLGYQFRERIYSKATGYMTEEYMQKCYGYVPQSMVPLYESGFDVLRASFEEVLSHAIAATDKFTVYGRVDNVNLNSHSVRLDDGERFSYDFLLNTISLPDFLRVCGMQFGLEFKSKPVTICTTDTDIGDFGTVHVMDKGNPVSRFISNTIRTQVYTETFEELVDRRNVVAWLRHGKILFDGKLDFAKKNLFSLLETMGVFQVGRFAQWQQHHDSENSVMEVENILHNKIKVASAA